MNYLEILGRNIVARMAAQLLFMPSQGALAKAGYQERKPLLQTATALAVELFSEAFLSQLT